MPRRLVRAVLLPSLLACAPSEQAPVPTAEPPPNIILVLVDALRRDHLGLYGYDRPTTPFLDELGRSGVVFDDAHAQASQTFNSTATLFTSRYFPLLGKARGFPAGTGFDQEVRERHAFQPVLLDENLTVAEVLQAAGFATVGIFTNPHHHPDSGFWQGFDEAVLLPRSDDATAYARAPTVADALLSWLEGPEGREPFFVYLHFMDPHNPYRPPYRIRRHFVAERGRDAYTNGPPDGPVSAADLSYMKGLYDGEIRFVDDVLGLLAGALEDRGFWRRTLMIVGADHGEELLEHGGFGHGVTLEPEVLRVPLIVGGPVLEERAWGARRVPGVVRNLDIAPTIAALAGVLAPETFRGRSLLPELSVSRPRGEQGPPSYAWVGDLRSMTTAEWHLLRVETDGPVKLYDRTTDSEGRENVAEQNPGVVEALLAHLDELEAEKTRTEELAGELARGVVKETPDEILALLRALGYVAEPSSLPAP